MKRRQRRRVSAEPPELPLAAMVDMMVNVLIFLLALYGSSLAGFDPNQVQLPASSAQQTPKDPVQLVISSAGILVDGKPIVPLQAGTEPWTLDSALVEDGLIPSLIPSLRPTGFTADSPTSSQIVCDKRIRWEILGPVTRTLQSARYEKFRFIVMGEAEKK